MKLNNTLKFGFIAFIVSALSAFAGDVNGAWKYTVEGPQGKTMEATVTLKNDNGKLSGTVDNKAGKAAIENATLVGDALSFTVTREFKKHKLTTHYTGKVEGDVIKGNIQSTGRGGKTLNTPWEARREK
jgi:hypothetical protein